MTSLVEIRTGSTEPLYNIGVVSRMTGISMATLRAWERRYDFPDSKRTLGGHRLYTEQDILRLRWVKERIDKGMQTAQSIRALHHQEETGESILTESALAQGKLQREQYFVGSGKLETDGHQPFFANAIDRLIGALINRKIEEADEVLADALVLFPPEALILHLIRPVMNEIGCMWENGKINVSTEHLATNYLRQRMLMWMVSGPPPRTRSSILLACAPDEWHEGSLLIMGALLRRRQWPVLYLGQAVPLPDLAAFVEDAKPALVILIAMTEEAAQNLSSWQQYLPDTATKGTPIVCFGGLVFVEKPEWRMKVPGIYLGDTFEEGITAVEKLLTS